MKKLLVLILVYILVGCGLPGLGGKGRSDIIIGSGNTTERQIMSEVIMQMIAEYEPNLKVEIVNNLGSSVLIFQAINRGNINLSSAMYTGTSLLGELNSDPIFDPDETFEAVVKGYHEKFDATWFPSYGFENTYAFMVRKEFAKEHNLKTVSDLESIVGTIGVGTDSSWLQRPLDGYEEFKINYGFSFDNLYPMEIGLVYSALENDQLQVALGYSTDGRIDAFDLVVLEDDKNHFPSYAVSPVIKNETLEKYPMLEPILLKLAGSISQEDMQAMNRKSDELGIEPREVAKEFLIENDYFKSVDQGSLSDIKLYHDIRKESIYD